MSIKDVIKKSVLESSMYNQSISVETIIAMVVDLVIALLVGLLIYYIYKRYYKGVIFSKSYAMTLVGMTVLTCMITLAISTNIVISLGMVGALSIVRFRTAIKEPLDLMYLFWAIGMGITIGASMYILVIITSIIMIAMVVLFSKTTTHGKAYLLIVNYSDNHTGDEIIRTLGKQKYTVRSKVLRDDNIEMTIHINVRNANTIFSEKIQQLEGVKDVTMLEYNGEYHE